MHISTVLCCVLISFAVLSEQTFNSAFANYQKADATGDTATAVKYANLSYELGAKAFGENSETALGLKYITHLLTGRIINLNKTIDVSKKLSDDSPEHAHVYYYRLAKVLNLPPLKFVFAMRSFAIHEQAEKYLIDALGDTDVKVVEMQFAMAQDLYSRKQVSASIKYYKKVINAFELESISTHPSLIEAHATVVRISELNKNSEAATRHAFKL